MKVNLEAVVGFVNRAPAPEGQPVPAKVGATAQATVPRKPYEMTVNDRRFLRSLRIAAEEPPRSRKRTSPRPRGHEGHAARGSFVASFYPL